MEDLIAWLRACLDDDEKTARAAGGDSGDLSIFEVHNLTDWDGTNLPDAEATHIARHDPAAVLADVAAKRALLDRYAATLTETPADLGGSNTRMAELLIEETRDTLEMVVRTLALAYRHRPGFKESWGV